MKRGNKYYKRSKISEWKFRLLVRYFALDFSATDAARMTNLTRKSVTSIFLKMRQRIARECKRASPFATGELEPDESHSCTLCICGKRGCGTSNRTPVFTILEHRKRIYTEMVPDCKKAALRALIRGHLADHVRLNLNGWHGYHGLVDVEHGKPFTINRKAVKDSFEAIRATEKNIEEFWSFARRRLEKFYGVSNRTFYLHLKECEWRYHLPQRDLYAELLKLLRKHPI